MENIERKEGMKITCVNEACNGNQQSNIFAHFIESARNNEMDASHFRFLPRHF